MPSRLARADRALLRAVRARADGSPLLPAARALSIAGEHAGCWLALGLAGAALDSARRGRWLRGAVVVAATYGANTAIKRVVRRPRPTLPGLPPLASTPSALSFPSAHASTSFAAVRVYGGLAPAPALAAVASAMAVSRVFLGVHYPSDVAAGVGLGLTLGTILRRP